MLKKRVLLSCVLIFLMTFLMQTRSYTIAKIENSADIKISSSEDALISVPDNINIDVNKHITETITKTITDNGNIEDKQSKIEVDLNGDNLEIKNNLNHAICVSVNIDGKSKDFSLKNNKKREIMPGRLIDDISYKVDDNIEEGTQEVHIIVSAVWEGGSAEIKSCLNINVDKITDVYENEVDFRTPMVTLEPVPNEFKSEIPYESIEEGEKIESEIINIRENMEEEIEEENQLKSEEETELKYETESENKTELKYETESENKTQLEDEYNLYNESQSESELLSNDSQL